LRLEPSKQESSTDSAAQLTLREKSDQISTPSTNSRKCKYPVVKCYLSKRWFFIDDPEIRYHKHCHKWFHLEASRIYYKNQIQLGTRNHSRGRSAHRGIGVCKFCGNFDLKENLPNAGAHAKCKRVFAKNCNKIGTNGGRTFTTEQWLHTLTVKTKTSAFYSLWSVKTTSANSPASPLKPVDVKGQKGITATLPQAFVASYSQMLIPFLEELST